MTREEQLRFCKVCENQLFDMHQGIICNLTGEKATFESTCESFIQDVRLSIEEEYKRYMHKTVSRGTRFANYIIDRIFIFILTLALGFFFGIILALFAPDSVQKLDTDSKLLNYLFAFIIGMVYYTLMESLSGRSIGKLITKTKVVNLDGTKPGFSTILVRSLCRFIPFEPLSFFSSEASGWHDRMTDTKVVEV